VEPREKLVVLYQELHELTEPVCANRHGDGCRAPRSCCDPLVCEQMAAHAKDHWGVAYESTGHPQYPLMGPEGCVAKPHERGLCTLHVCCINSLGFKPGDHEWTEHYYELRGQIEAIEWELWGKQECKTRGFL
jgi:hypothetical protein